jgi:hypothetical protein
VALDSHAGWNVLLGVNGTGKSTLLQAMALSALGPTFGYDLLPSELRKGWVRRGSSFGTFSSQLVTSTHDVVLSRPRKRPFEARIHVTGASPATIDGVEVRQPQLFVPPRLRASLDAGPYSGAPGWFSAGYGPFRRLGNDGNEDGQRSARVGGPAGQHVSLFRESAALTSCEPWLTRLHNTANDPALKAEERQAAQVHLEVVRKLVDSLLPFGLRVGTISSREVTFANAAGLEVEFWQLSDGFRSFLAMAIDLLRQILVADEWGRVGGSEEGAQVDTEGVVFIDEADAHLHPEWQRELGRRMCRVFPNIQFIVSTHSPFIAQSAMPGGLFVLEAQGDEVVVNQPEMSVEGWRADDILLSPLFGLRSTRDEDTETKIRERTDLLAKAPRSVDEEEQLRTLTATLRGRLVAAGDTLDELDTDARIEAWLRAHGSRA